MALVFVFRYKVSFVGEYSVLTQRMEIGKWMQREGVDSFESGSLEEALVALFKIHRKALGFSLPSAEILFDQQLAA